MTKSGVDSTKVMAELRRLERQAPAVVEHGLGVWAENLVSEMQQEGVCPRDTGRLRDSHGQGMVRTGVIRIFANTTYAAAVHERHPTQEKWFQRVLNSMALPTLKTAADKMRAVIESGGSVAATVRRTAFDAIASGAAKRGERTYRKEMARRAREKSKNNRNK